MLDRAENGWTDGGGEDHPPLETQYVEETTEHGIKQYGEYYPVFVGPKSYSALIRDPRWITEQEGKSQDGISTYLKGYGGSYRNAVIIKVPKLTESNGVQRAGIIRSDSPDYTGFSGSYTGFDGYKANDDTVTEINFMMGVGAMCQAFDEVPDYGEDDNYDSGRKLRIYEEQFMAAKKVKLVGESTEEQQSIFHNKDYGVIVAPSTIE
ncbi:MAG: hypothetical protein HF962_00530 [Sulfurovum sp.]|nr:hypothetical protein [Sulfurovum sp.]